jgi:hypothetical protein
MIPVYKGRENDAGGDQTILRALINNQPTLVLVNGPLDLAPLPGSGHGLVVAGRPVGMLAKGDFSSDGQGVAGIGGSGVVGTAQGSTVPTTKAAVVGLSLASNAANGNGVSGVSERLNGVEGQSFTQAASGVYGYNMSGGGFGVAARSNVPPPTISDGILVFPPFGAAIYGQNTAGGDAALLYGSVHVNGNLNKTSGGFEIDDPRDPANSYLYHSFVESPDMMNVYNGNVTTDADGNATVELPGYFESLNRDFRYQLTVIGEFAQAIVAEEVRDNRFAIKTDKPNVRVSWQVIGIRQDAWANAHRIEPEVQKPEGYRGKYVSPKEHDQPETAGIYYVELPVSEETAIGSGQQQKQQRE